MEYIRSTINYVYEDKLIRKSSLHYLIPAIIGLVFGQLSPVIGGICISGSLGEVPFSALSTVEPHWLPGRRGMRNHHLQVLGFRR